MSSSDHDPTAPTRQTRSASPLFSWSQDQLIRLEYEWRRLQRNLAYHPHLRLVSMQDDPPDEYEIEFRVRTLCVAESGDLEYTDVVPMRVLLPANFPYAPPTVRPLKGLFHPNVSWEGVHLSSSWQPTDTLGDFLKKVGELLAFRAYDPESVVNPAAMEWMEANAESLPLDGSADFSPEAGGDPLDRISRHGPLTLQQIRKQLDGLRDAMLNPDGAPGSPEVRDFTRHTRQTLNLFMESDLPDGLRDEANQLDEWAGELPASLAVWEFLREQRAAVAALRTTNGALAEKQKPLLDQIKALEALAPATLPTDANAALAAVPQLKAIELVRLKLPSLVRDADQLLKDLYEQVQALDLASGATPVLNDSLLGRQLQAEVDASAKASRSAREAAAGLLAATESVLSRARGDAQGVKQLGGWREYLDFLITGRVLEKKLARQGAAGVHAFYIENVSGEFGPFQLEEPVDLGTARVAVRSTARNRIRLIDLHTSEIVGRSDTGSLVIKLAGSTKEAGELNTFRLSERWEDLAVQFDFLVRQTEQSIVQLTVSAPASESWCGKLLAVLHRSESVHFIREQHRKLSHRWRLLLADLQALGPIKARIETWNFVQRTVEGVPPLIRRLAEQRVIFKKCMADLGAIVSRCGRDVDSDRLVIPPQLARPYSENVALRDRTRQEVGRLEKHLVQVGSQVARQLASRSLVGAPGMPTFRVLPPFPPDLAELVSAMTDDALKEQVRNLETTLEMPLLGEAWQDAAPPGSARPQKARPAATSAGGSPAVAPPAAAPPKPHETARSAAPPAPAEEEVLEAEWVPDSEEVPETQPAAHENGFSLDDAAEESDHIDM